MREGLGLFIKEGSVDLVHLRSEGDRLYLVGIARSDIKASTPEKRRDVLSDSISEVFKQVRPKTKNLVVCLSSKLTALKRVEVPSATPKTAKRLIKEKGKKAVSARSYDITSFYVSPLKLSSTANTEAVFAVADGKGVKDCLDVLQGLRILPMTIEPVSQSVLRVLRESEQLVRNEPVLILHFETDMLLNATVINEGDILLCRNLYLGTRGKKFIDDLVLQLDYLSDYFRLPPHKFQISKIILCGLANPDIWIAPLKQRFRLNVEAENMAAILSNPPDTRQWSAAVGAALQGLRGQPDQLNLMPPTFTKLMKISMVIMSFLLIGIISFSTLYLINYLKAPKETKEPTIEELSQGQRRTPQPSFAITFRIRLQGVVLQGRERYALINDEVYKEGDYIRGYTVESIDIKDKSIILKKGEKTVRIFLYETYELEGE